MLPFVDAHRLGLQADSSLTLNQKIGKDPACTI